MHYPSLADASTLCSRSMPNPSTISSSVYGGVSRASESRRPARERPRIKRKYRDASCPASAHAHGKHARKHDPVRYGYDSSGYPHLHLHGDGRDHDLPPAIDEYMQEDLVGFDAGALPTEVTSLLSHPYTPYTHSPQVEENRHGHSHEPQTSQIQMFREEIRTLLEYTGPIFGTHLSEYMLVVIPVIFIGHYSTAALGAITLGSMFATITGFSIIQGFISALDSLLPGTWTSNQPELVGIWTQRMAVVMTACLVPITIIWFNAEPIFLLLHKDRQVSHMASQYLRWISLGLPAYSFNLISRRYYKSQGRFSVPTKITFIVAPVSALLTYLFVFGPPPLQIGFIGAPIASAISLNLIALLFLLHATFYEPRTVWPPLSTKVFSGLGVLVHLGICGVGQIGLRLWAWELLTLASSLLGPVELASQSILVISASTVFRIPFALGIATIVRIGNLLGQKDPVRAGIAAKSAMGLGMTISAFASIIVLIFAKHWAYIFNHDPEVISIVQRIMPLIALFQVFHGTCAVTGAIARARGKQLTGAVVNLGAYYIMGFPIGIYLAFMHGYGLRGLWIGMTISLIYCATVGLWLCTHVDWESEVENVFKRIRSYEHVAVASGCTTPSSSSSSSSDSE